MPLRIQPLVGHDPPHSCRETCRDSYSVWCRRSVWGLTSLETFPSFFGRIRGIPIFSTCTGSIFHVVYEEDSGKLPVPSSIRATVSFSYLHTR